MRRSWRGWRLSAFISTARYLSWRRQYIPTIPTIFSRCTVSERCLDLSALRFCTLCHYLFVVVRCSYSAFLFELLNKHGDDDDDGTKRRGLLYHENDLATPPTWLSPVRLVPAYNFSQQGNITAVPVQCALFPYMSPDLKVILSQKAAGSPCSHGIRAGSRAGDTDIWVTGNGRLAPSV